MNTRLNHPLIEKLIAHYQRTPCDGWGSNTCVLGVLNKWDEEVARFGYGRGFDPCLLARKLGIDFNDANKLFFLSPAIYPRCPPLHDRDEKWSFSPFAVFALKQLLSGQHINFDDYPEE